MSGLETNIMNSDLPEDEKKELIRRIREIKKEDFLINGVMKYDPLSPRSRSVGNYSDKPKKKQ